MKRAQITIRRQEPVGIFVDHVKEKYDRKEKDEEYLFRQRSFIGLFLGHSDPLIMRTVL